jgi:hypothetical protein
MELELRPQEQQPYGHICRLPWPVDPEIPEGHLCECGRRWVYQPARWEPLMTLEELRLRQDAGEFLRGIVPAFARPLPKESPSLLASEPPESAVIVRIPRRKS